MKIYEVIDSPEKWVKSDFARDSNGCSIDPLSPEAVCWCFVGAMKKCYGQEWVTKSEIYQKVRRFLIALGKLEDFQGISIWNDCSTYEEVIRVAKELDV